MLNINHVISEDALRVKLVAEKIESLSIQEALTEMEKAELEDLEILKEYLETMLGVEEDLESIDKMINEKEDEYFRTPQQHMQEKRDAWAYE